MCTKVCWHTKNEIGRASWEHPAVGRFGHFRTHRTCRPAGLCPPGATIFRAHTADRFYNLSVIYLNSIFVCIEVFNMLAQMTYIPSSWRSQRMNSCRLLLLQVPLLWQITQKICRPAISNIFDTAGRRRAGIGSTHDARPMPRFWNSHNRCPTDAPRHPTMTGWCKIGRPAGFVNSRL